MSPRRTSYRRSPESGGQSPTLDRHCRLLSLDVFGLALERLVLEAADVHRLVATQLPRPLDEAYPGLRQLAEDRAQAQAQAQAAGCPIIGLADITDQLESLLVAVVPDARSVARRAIEGEVALEQRLSRPSPEAGRLVDQARQLGIPCAFVADTYLPRDLVAAMLRTAGLPADLVLVSSHEGVTKAGGELYRHLAERAHLGPERITHLGPDPELDVTAAAGVGVRSRHMALARQHLAPSLSIGLSPPTAIDSAALALAGRAWLAPVLAAHCWR